MKIITKIASIILCSCFLYGQSINVENKWQLKGAMEDINLTVFSNSCADIIWSFDSDLNSWGIYLTNSSKYSVPTDMRLIDKINPGDGFWVKGDSNCSVNTSPTTKIFYTSIGSFIITDNGILQDTAGNEIQGWTITPIDKTKDVLATNPDISVFTADYSKLLSSKIIRHINYIETITAKATDYNLTARDDNEAIYSGFGLKTRLGKIADVEELVKDYSSWLQKFKDNPEEISSSSIAQVSYLDLPDYGSSSAVSIDGDRVYIYIDGIKISQAFDTDYETTLKSFTNKISNVAGLKAYIADESTKEIASSGEKWKAGVIRIESLIPGKEFIINESGMVSFGATTQGTYGNITNAVTGTGRGALKSSRDALSSSIKDAGAEFIEITNTIDQSASTGSLQLKLDTLGISDRAFGKFTVDDTGLITITQDGAEFAVGKVKIVISSFYD